MKTSDAVNLLVFQETQELPLFSLHCENSHLTLQELLYAEDALAHLILRRY